MTIIERVRGVGASLGLIKNYTVAPNAQLQEFVPNYKPPTPKDLNTYIAPVQLGRYRQDVQSWRKAVTEAENAWYPQRVDMQRLYLDVILNGHVQACLRKRRTLTLLRDFRLVDASGKENEAATKLFTGKWFEAFLSHAINAIYFGYSLITIEDIVNGVPKGCGIIKRHNVSPDRYNVTQYTYSIGGVPFMEEPFAPWCVYVATPSETGISDCGYGLLYDVGIYEIICRNLLGFNSDWVEIFGQPIRHAKTNKSQVDPERAMLEKAMIEMGSSAFIITDPTDEIELLQTTNSLGKQNPYENLEIRCEQKISKLILGHADALDSTAGKLGGNQGGEKSPAQIALDEIQTMDGRFIANIVNQDLIPKLQALGVKIPLGLVFEFSNDAEVNEARVAEDKNNETTVKNVLTLSQAGFEVDPTYITERTGIPVTKKEVAPPAVAPNKSFEDIKNEIKQLYNHKH